MNTKTILAFACAAVLAGCAAPVPPAPPPMTSPVFTLWSPTFPDGASLTTAHAGNLAGNPNCVGQNVTPPLAWTNVPAGTRSLALLGVAHWVAYGISPAINGFAENEIGQLSSRYVGGKSTLNLGSYMGPCPPAGTGQHHYVYTLIATDAEPTEIPAGLTMQELLTRLQGKAKVASSIVLRYGRP
jgi:phosphatidylethanolamine-binding protein (PEBP) family uncharacterized protein